jgi:uncharacterized protein YyaL (SSP411 family)
MNNPVDWYPWGEEAFAEAKERDVPIFLSIGYSSCHWCHVMEKESFEDFETAKLLNDNFVAIKVDREERPDVDQIYMKAVQAMTGSGGWPLSVFLTPSLEPFYGGTYFPRVSTQGMPGFAHLLRNISNAWKMDRKNILESSKQIRAALAETSALNSSRVDESALDACYSELARYYDQEYGGFGSAPKFPTPSNLFFLMRYYLRNGTEAALTMATKTLLEMSRGGIYDQIGGGFHRYSTDKRWLIPHFEKMLYDNALLSSALAEAYQITRDKRFEKIVRETLDYVKREMSSSEGGFYSAQDADSVQGEGMYYAWNRNEMEQVLRSSQIEVFDDASIDAIISYFGLEGAGNFEDGWSVLTARKDIQIVEKEKGIGPGRLENLISSAKKILYTEREKRPRPLTDDKILTGWNGLMISAFSKASQVLRDPDYCDVATRAAKFVLQNLKTTSADGMIELKRRYRDGEVKDSGVLEDYAYFGNALLDLYETSFDPQVLREAISICDSMIKFFYDEKHGGFFEAPKDTPNLIVRTKEGFDGAIPSANSIASLFSLRVGESTSNEKYKQVARRSIESFARTIEVAPSSHTELLCVLDYMTGRQREIVISGDLSQVSMQDLLNELRARFIPNAVIVHASPELGESIPLLEGRIAKPGQPPCVYVCSSYSCKLPANNAVDLRIALSE